MSKKKINNTTKKLKILVKKLYLKYIIKKSEEKIFLIKVKLNINENNSRMINIDENRDNNNNENNHSTISNNYCHSEVLEDYEDNFNNIDYNNISDSHVSDDDGFWDRISDSDNGTRNSSEEVSTQTSA